MARVKIVNSRKYEAACYPTVEDTVGYISPEGGGERPLFPRDGDIYLQWV